MIVRRYLCYAGAIAALGLVVSFAAVAVGAIAGFVAAVIVLVTQ